MGTISGPRERKPRRERGVPLLLSPETAVFRPQRLQRRRDFRFIEIQRCRGCREQRVAIDLHDLDAEGAERARERIADGEPLGDMDLRVRGEDALERRGVAAATAEDRAAFESAARVPNLARERSQARKRVVQLFFEPATDDLGRIRRRRCLSC